MTFFYQDACSGFLFSLMIFSTRTTKRPVPLEHCLFYSGELYKVCENEVFLPHGYKAAKDVHKKKTTSSVSGGTGLRPGSSTAADKGRGQRRDSSSQAKQHKHSGPQKFGNFGAGWGTQSTGSGQNVMGFRRSESSLWLTLINKLLKKSLLPVCNNITFFFTCKFPCILSSPRCMLTI